MALDLMAEIGPGNNFLGEEHTRKFLRREHFLPKLADRHSYGTWEELGAKDMPERAHDRVAQILAKHEVPLLPDNVRGELQDILVTARHHLNAE